MSSHSFTNSSGREVRWGLDVPTGGFFFNEFYRDEEITTEGDEELASTGQALTLTELVSEIESRFSHSVDLEQVAYDLKHATSPTPLQINVSTMFGVNLVAKLKAVDEDLEKNWYSS